MKDAEEKLAMYEAEVKNLTEMVAYLEREKKHLYVLLVGAALSPLLGFYKPVLGGGITALFIVMFCTGFYFNFVHRNERTMHLENAQDELARLKEEFGERTDHA